MSLSSLTVTAKAMLLRLAFPFRGQKEQASSGLSLLIGKQIARLKLRIKKKTFLSQGSFHKEIASGIDRLAKQAAEEAMTNRDTTSSINLCMDVMDISHLTKF